MYLNVLKGQLTKIDYLFSEVRYLRWALYAWTGISAEGGTNVLGLPVDNKARRRRLWWEKDSIVPVFENKLSAASKNPPFLQMPNVPISKRRQGLSHPPQTNVHDPSGDSSHWT